MTKTDDRRSILQPLTDAEAATIEGGFCGLFPQFPIIGPNGIPQPVPCDGWPTQQN
jgi:hypothetical protein